MLDGHLKSFVTLGQIGNVIVADSVVGGFTAHLEEAHPTPDTARRKFEAVANFEALARQQRRRRHRSVILSQFVLQLAEQ